jgi:succinate dehydrogenase / fumarate reductase flavoprotein subunit
MDENLGSENPYKVQQDLQEVMQDKVGIVRVEAEMQQALEEMAKLKQRSRQVHIPGNREYNPGWHTAMDLHNLMTVSEAVTRAAIVRKESRGGQFRDDHPNKDSRTFGRVNTVISKAPDGTMQLRLEPIPPMPEELKQVIRDENAKMPEELS